MRAVPRTQFHTTPAQPWSMPYKNSGCSLTHITHPKYSSSKGFNEDRLLDEATNTARSGAALAAATTAPDATRSMVLCYLRP